MRSACEESLLNRLLNEMDGLREDAHGSVYSYFQSARTNWKRR